MEIEQQLRLALVPCSPDVALRARVMARVSTASVGPRGRVRRGRAILLGTIAAAAAAAAPFALQFISASAPDVAVVPSSTQPMPDAGAAGGFETLPPLPVEDEGVPAAQVPAGASVPSAPPKPVAAIQQVPMADAADVQAGVLTLRVQPLENHAADEATRTAIEQFHASFLQALRSKSGIALVEPDSGGSTGIDADYVLSVTGRGPVRPDTFNVSISEGAREQVNGMFPGSMLVNATGLIAPTCADPQRCADPVNLGVMMAERVVDRLASRE